jgi:aldose 1-epimerase
MKVDESWIVLQRQQPAMRMILAPKQGGAIRELTHEGEDVLRPTPAGAGLDPFDLACFPMVPYANRIAHGRFRHGNRQVQLKRNWSGDPHPLHGQGWRAPWSLVAASTSSAILRFEGGGDEWPWRYRCEQRFELLPDGVSIELSIQSLADEPMPAMLGLHPYFPNAAHAKLEAQLPRVWLTDDAALPLTEAATPAAWCFEPARELQQVPLDHCFAGWNGTAVLRWPGRALRITAPDCRFLQIYAPASQDFFCIEPQSAAAGALSTGEVRTLAPGERFAIALHLAPGGH